MKIGSELDKMSKKGPSPIGHPKLDRGGKRVMSFLYVRLMRSKLDYINILLRVFARNYHRSI